VVTVLKYEGLTVANFTDDLKAQVCANVLALSPGGECEVTGVYPGSVNVVVKVTYPTAAEATQLSVTLADDSGQTQQTLVESFPSGTTIEVLSVEEEEIPQDPLPTLSPSNVVVGVSTTCATSLSVTWNAPTGNTAPILSYMVSCLLSDESGTSVLVLSPNTTATLNVQADEEYTCSVTSISTQGTSPAVAGNAVTYTYVFK